MRISIPVPRLTALVALLAPICAGCPNANTYGTPRTVPKGEIQHSVAVEALGWANPGTTSGVVPVLPTYTFRVGVHDRIDIGARVANLSSLGVDVKFNLVRGRFDLAIDPGAQALYLSANGVGAGIAYLHLPILLAVNPTEWFSIVLSPGVVGAIASASVNDTSGRTTASSSGVLGRLGLGFDFRIGKSFALHPEVTVMRSFQNEALLINAGLGINFGKSPSYADLSGDPPVNGATPAANAPPPVAP